MFRGLVTRGIIETSYVNVALIVTVAGRAWYVFMTSGQELSL